MTWRLWAPEKTVSNETATWVMTIEPPAWGGCQLCSRDCTLWRVRKARHSFVRGRGGTHVIGWESPSWGNEWALTEVLPLIHGERLACRIFLGLQTGRRTQAEMHGRACQVSLPQARLQTGSQRKLGWGHYTSKQCLSMKQESPNGTDHEVVNRNISGDRRQCREGKGQREI